MVVFGDPGLRGVSALGGGWIGGGVGPFAQGRLNEAFGLAVGARRVGPGPDVPEGECREAIAEGVAAVSGAVVGHDALDRDAVAGEPIERAVEEGDGAFFLLVRRAVGRWEP